MRKRITAKLIPHFDARGMQRLYGETERRAFRHEAFSVDIWRTRSGRIFARFWSRGSEVDWESYEVIGMNLSAPIPAMDERWFPRVLRKQYDDWMIENHEILLNGRSI